MRTWFLFLLLFCLGSTLFAQSLIPNKHFGTNGTVTTNFGYDRYNYVDAIAVQNDGKIIIAGNSSLIRVFADGTLDSSFGTNGTCGLPGFYWVRKLLVQSDGKIVGMSSGGGYTSFIRVTADGHLDNSYGTDGVSKMYIENNEYYYFTNCAITNDNRILITGSGDGDLSGSLIVGRLLPTGSLDSSFNGNGLVIIKETAAATSWKPGVIAVQSTGKVVVGAVLFKGLDEISINLLRLNADGTPDNSFNQSGRFTYVLNPSSGSANMAIQVQSNDGILVGGGNDGRIFAIKLLANGQADPVFNGNGIAVSNALYGQPMNIFLRPNGKVLLAGMVFPDLNADTDYGAVQFNANGTPDAAFGTNGARIISVGSNDIIAGAVLQGDGALAIVGYAWDIYVTTMVKLDVSGNPDNSFGDNGIKKLQLIGSDDAIVTLIEQPDKKLLAGGWKSSGFIDSSNLVIARYKSDGKSLDSTFGVAGRAVNNDPTLEFSSMALQSTGKIVLSSTQYSGYDSNSTVIELNILTRFNSNGTIDNSFGTAGRYVSGRIHHYFEPASIKLLADDKILLCYNQYADDGTGLVLTRLTSNGLPDNSFGAGGTVILNTDNYIANSLGLQQDGKIVISAKQDGTDSTTCFLIRLLANGSFDNSFDDDGIKKVASVANISDGTAGLGFTADGKIVSAASLYENNLEKYITTFYRYNTDGSPDLTFNKTGSFTIPVAAEFPNLYSENFAIDKDNSIYIIGEAHNAANDSTLPFIVRIKNTGTIDTTVDYTNNGFLFIQDADVFGTLTVLADSSLVLAGGQEQSIFRKESDFFISKYKRLANGYRFIGNGNWSNPANWEAGKVPPAVLPAGSYVYVEPAAGGKCILDISQQISSDDNIVVASGKNLIITGNLIIK